MEEYLHGMWVWSIKISNSAKRYRHEICAGACGTAFKNKGVQMVLMR